jgi:hypothetical protein
LNGTADHLKDDEDRPDPRVTGLTTDFVGEVRAALGLDGPERVRSLVTPLGYADLADLLESLDSRERAELVRAIRDSFDPTVLTALDDSVRLDVVEQFSTADLAAAIAKLESDDALYLIETLDDDRRIAVMQAMPAAFRAILEQGLSYPESSAGRLMQRDVVAVPASGRWERRSTSCAAATACPTISTICSWSIRPTVPPERCRPAGFCGTRARRASAISWTTGVSAFRPPWTRSRWPTSSAATIWSPSRSWTTPSA